MTNPDEVLRGVTVYDRKIRGEACLRANLDPDRVPLNTLEEIVHRGLLKYYIEVVVGELVEFEAQLAVHDMLPGPKDPY